MSPPLHQVRAFVAIHLPRGLRERFRSLQDKLRLGDLDSIRWTPPAQIHLTLKFFGDLDASTLDDLEAALRQACYGARSFELRAGGLGGFPDLRQPQVLWVGVRGELAALRTLRQRIERETAGWGGREEHEFSPHLTVGRVKMESAPGNRKVSERLEAFRAAEFGAWTADEIHLTRSELGAGGARHTTLARIKLTHPA